MHRTRTLRGPLRRPSCYVGGTGKSKTRRDTSNRVPESRIPVVLVRLFGGDPRLFGERGLPKKTTPRSKKTEPRPERTRGPPKKTDPRSKGTEPRPQWTRGLPKKGRV